MTGVRNATGVVKSDHYYTGDGSHQTVVTGGLPEGTLPGGVKASVMIGKDVRQDRTPNDDPTVVDVHLRRPVTDGVELKGRVRTSYTEENPSTQFRGGIQVSHPITKRDKAYAQGYVAQRVNYRGTNPKATVGIFAGIDHQFSDNVSGYVEAQAYDVSDFGRANIGVNVGLKLTF